MSPRYRVMTTSGVYASHLCNLQDAAKQVRWAREDGREGIAVLDAEGADVTEAAMSPRTDKGDGSSDRKDRLG